MFRLIERQFGPRWLPRRRVPIFRQTSRGCNRPPPRFRAWSSWSNADRVGCRSRVRWPIGRSSSYLHRRTCRNAASRFRGGRRRSLRSIVHDREWSCADWRRGQVTAGRLARRRLHHGRIGNLPCPGTDVGRTRCLGRKSRSDIDYGNLIGAAGENEPRQLADGYSTDRRHDASLHTVRVQMLWTRCFGMSPRGETAIPIIKLQRNSNGPVKGLIKKLSPAKRRAGGRATLLRVRIGPDIRGPVYGLDRKLAWP
jgi:hypothetical protein